MNQSNSSSDAAQAMRRGVEYLLRQQAADGGWHSTTYGQMKGGAALTALVLDAFSQLPAAALKDHMAAIACGLEFFKPGFGKRRTIAAADGSLDFPTYGSGLYLTVVARLQPQQEFVAQHVQLCREYLLAAQLLEPRGFAAEHPSYGGWDFLGAGDADAITTGTNVSVVAHVLEGIASDKSAAAEKARTSAKGWLLRTQQADGGFAFTPEPMSLNNKADFSDKARLKPRSYGTATCDGIRGLLATGLTAEDEAIRRSLAWLSERPVLEVVPGFEALPAEAEWHRGLRFYYYSSLARLLPHFIKAEQIARAQGIERLLLKEQRTDGRWQNESDRMRENDPLIATALALSALAHLSA